MKTVYLISIIVLWTLIVIQIVQLVRSGRLLKRQMKELKELDDIHQKCNQLYDEMNEEKQKYQDAKERLLATLLPDLEETTEDDTPPQEGEGPEFLYSHKNNEITIHAARCDLEWLATEIGYVTHRLYCGLYSKEPESAEVFREFVMMTIAGDDSPTWDISIANVGNMIIIPKEVEETADEE